MLMCMHTFLAEGRACLRTHAPGQQCEWILSCRSACQSYRALGQCIRSGLVCYIYLAQKMKKYINPFILVVHYNVSIFRAVELRAPRP